MGFSPSISPAGRGQLMKMLINLEQHGAILSSYNASFYRKFDPIMQHSAGNDQFAFHTFLLALDTDKSTFTKGRAHYSQLIFDLELTVHHTFLIISFF